MEARQRVSVRVANMGRRRIWIGVKDRGKGRGARYEGFGPRVSLDANFRRSDKHRTRRGSYLTRYVRFSDRGDR
jgi:hypothetical protein